MAWRGSPSGPTVRQRLQPTPGPASGPLERRSGGGHGITRGRQVRNACAAHRARPDRGGEAGLSLTDIDAFEVNEAFASVVLAWQAETGADLSRVNVNGGATALGHPLGASGARLMTTLLSVLEQTGGRFGLQTMCEGGGMANATIIERL
jgi:hypothetical protein